MGLVILPIYYRGLRLSQEEGCRENVCKNGSKHAKGTVNHHLQKFAPFGLILSDRIKYICFVPRGEGEQRRGLMPQGRFLFSFIFFAGQLPQTFSFCSVKEIQFQSFSLDSPKFP